jgi:hypothetical protein
MCLGDADNKLSMSLAAGSGDQLPMFVGDADDKLSISLAAGGGSNRLSFLTDRIPQRTVRSLYFGAVTASVVVDAEDFSENLAHIYQAARAHISSSVQLPKKSCMPQCSSIKYRYTLSTILQVNVLSFRN